MADKIQNGVNNKSILVGNNLYRGRAHPIFMQAPDRRRHMYMIGKTGVGKSTLFANMALQDIQNLNGICFIDPHGETIDWLVNRIPKNSLDDVILFDPADTEHPLGLNLLDAQTEQEKDFLVGELIQIFYKLFDPERTGIIGPQFEHWLRNAALTIMAGEGGSLIEIPKLFIDKKFLAHRLKQVKDPIVLDFWTKQMAHTSEFHKSEMLNYFSSKFGHFLNNSVMRNIIGQRRSAFRFDEIVNNEKVLLVNLSKGKIGELNTQFLGLILVSKLQAAILGRARLDESKRHPFYVYVDEFQNLVTDTFISMLSESRKYGLGVHLTNQYFSQLPEKIQDAILGNVGTLLSFQVGMEDAERLAAEFEPITKENFLRLEKYNFYIKLLINGRTSEPFSGTSLPPAEKQTGIEQKIKQLGKLAYGVPRLLVERQIKNYLA
ncbi:MAG: type IV secretion system DNA-binding domain-containing protein [Candidatus Doudnabacteria bacterium]|nr:type IV secretion system DNA-binding domain-containing protein [Candidatus Doudnabacteria bacterium]